MTSNKRIAKNTLMLYVRMMFTMIISLYTSRVVLQNLGVNDYGLYQVVGGIVGLFAFVNTALSEGSTRFLMYGLGEGNDKRLADLFSTLLSCHIILGLIIVFLGETVGLWFVYKKLEIPTDRLDSALIVYHISIFTSFLTITQPPYSAAIKSHERMDIYAYTGIVDTILKLVIVYLLLVSPVDKLVFYASLLCVENFGMILYLRWFCTKHFKETKYHLVLNKKMLKEVLGYSSWNLYYNLASALNTQGLIILLNIFFNAGVVAALSIANTVKGAVSTLVDNFRVAATPQIVKQYAAGNKEESMNLVLSSTVYSFYLLYFLALPVFLVAPELIYLWLGVVPNYTIVFLRFMIIIAIFHLFASCFYTALSAIGKIRKNAIYRSTIYIICFPIIYILFKYGFSPIALSWVTLISEGVLGLIVLPYLIITIGDYKLTDILNVYKRCLLVLLLSIPIPLLAYYMISGGIIQRLLLISSICFLSTLLVVWIWGIDATMRKKIILLVINKIKKNDSTIRNH